MSSKRVRISKQKLAEVLHYWLSVEPTRQLVNYLVEEQGLNVYSSRYFKGIPDEICYLNMWLIIRAFEKTLEDPNKRNQCLDIFHQYVFRIHSAEIRNKFDDWMIAMALKYTEYNTAIKTIHPQGALWVLSKYVNKHLFGAIKGDAYLQTMIAEYIVEFSKGLERLIKSYEIE